MVRTLIACVALAALGSVTGYCLVRGRGTAPRADVVSEVASLGRSSRGALDVSTSTAAPEGLAVAAPAVVAARDASAEQQRAAPGEPGAARDAATAPMTAATAVTATTADAAVPSRPSSSKRCPAALLDEEGALVPGADPFLEQRLQWLLADYGVPEGAVVVLEPNSGQLLAAAGYLGRGAQEKRELALAPRFLAASIFKIVSAAALLERGVTPSASMMYSGGYRSVREDELKDVPRRDTATASLTDALARSLNVPFAKWADRKLDVTRLGAAARRFGFDVPLADGASCWGGADIPSERLDFARTSAGFGEVRLSAWHAAVLAAVVANRGELPSSLIPAGQPPKRILKASHAEDLAAMMAKTVTSGTARKAFTEGGRYLLGEHSVAGKTGSLVEGAGDGWREATWFVGFAPVDKPQVVVAALLQNSPEWRIRASYVGREALRTALLRTSPYRPTQDRVSRRGAKKKR